MFDGLCRSWTAPPPKADVKKLLGIHKYKDMSRVRPVIYASAERAAERALQTCKPNVRYRVVEVEGIDDDGLRTRDGFRFECRAFSQHLVGVTHVLIFAITLGHVHDKAVEDGFADGTDPIGPLFLDSAGWVTVEAATRLFVGEVKAELRDLGYDMTLRMAPGYDYKIRGDAARARWPLTDQQVLFDALLCEDLPIQLLESSAMLPKMSRSGMFGVKPIARSG